MKSEKKKTAVIGAGTIGASWTLNFAWKGADVILYDVKEEALKQAEKNIERNLALLRENGVISEKTEKETPRRIQMTAVLKDAVSDAEFIQECGPENYQMKWEILKEIEEAADPKVIIASSTSGLLITEEGKYMKHPERLVGGHPYNPPHLLPLVEIVKGEKSSEEAVKEAYDFYLAMGKEPVIVKKEASGFIANRIQVAVFREMIDLIEKGVCTMEDADKAVLYGPGLRWGLLGPMAVLHLGGGPGGIRATMEKQRESYDIRLADMADWKHFPEDLADIADRGMQEEIAHRPPEQGKSLPEMEAWRDEKLIQLLRLHGKL